MRPRYRRLFLRMIPYLIGFLAGVAIIDQWVWWSTRDQRFSRIEDVPHHKVGLLLGTSRYVLKEHKLNLFYIYRIRAAVQLFNAGKVDYILVSGDNRTASYNEPAMMLADLLRCRIPRDHIVLDYAGFRTYDSMIRCRDVFGEKDIVIISQPFHNARALFIANHTGMNAVAFNANDVQAAKRVKNFFRERGARVRMMFDLMFGTTPKLDGPHITIG